jgi:hypothetical protein
MASMIELDYNQHGGKNGSLLMTYISSDR